MLKRLHALVTGRVQGVFYRDFVQTHARQLQLTGWVRNLPDGTVEVLAKGDDVALTRLRVQLAQGSPRSHVDDVHVQYDTPNGEFAEFRIIT